MASKLKSIESYTLALRLYETYRRAPRAGWDDTGKRGKQNHAILIPRAQALDLADRLRSEANMTAVLAFERLNMIHVLEQLAAEDPDAVHCPQCGHVYRSSWMDGQCVYCACRQGAVNYVRQLQEDDSHE